MKYYLLILVGVSTILSGCAFSDKIQSGLDAYQTAKSLVSSSNEKHHTVLVAGYGTQLKGNATYEQYIKSVATYVNNVDNDVDSIVFSGSYTDSKTTSEAEAMNSYFNSQVDTTELANRGIHVYQETCAIVSWQNISYSQELLATQSISPTQVTVFGDINRADKLKTFAIYKFNFTDGLKTDVASLVNQSLNSTSVDYQGFDFGDAADSDEVRNAKFGAEILGAYDTALGNELLGKRLAEWTSNYGYDVADNLVAKGCSQYSGF